MVQSLKDVSMIYGLQQLGFAADYALKEADKLRPVGFLGQPISFWGDILGALGGVAGALYLKEPYDLVAAIVGGYLSTDLWNQLARIFPMSVAPTTQLPYTTPETVNTVMITTPSTYTPPGTVTTPQFIVKGRYRIT